MGLFSKQKKEVIPEISHQIYHGGQSSGTGGRGGAPSISSQAPSYRSSAPSYVPPSQGGGGYGARAPPPQQQYAQDGRQPSYNGGGGGQYGQQQQQSRGPSYNGADARNQLLAGAPPPRAPSGQGQYGAERGEDEYQSQQQEDPEEEEVEGIKQQMRSVGLPVARRAQSGGVAKPTADPARPPGSSSRRVLHRPATPSASLARQKRLQGPLLTSSGTSLVSLRPAHSCGLPGPEADEHTSFRSVCEHCEIESIV